MHVPYLFSFSSSFLLPALYFLLPFLNSCQKILGDFGGSMGLGRYGGWSPLIPFRLALASNRVEQWFIELSNRVEQLSVS